MNLRKEIERRLRDGGWTKKRANGKHTVWCHPNGSSYTLPKGTMSDNLTRKTNILKAIQKAETQGRKP